MSRIAGDLAAEHLLKVPDLAKGKVIIFGAGIAGIRTIVSLKDKVNEIIVVEKLPEKEGDPNVRERVNWLLLSLGFHKHRVLEKIPEDMVEQIFRDAAGIIFSQRKGAEKAEKVCRLQDIKGVVKPNAGIVDIAIDQGGSIDYDGISEEDNITTKISKYREALRGYRYYAETNMPKEKPVECSNMHGYAILPYCAALLLLCAEHDGPSEATSYILTKGVNKFDKLNALPQSYNEDFFQNVVQDLRNGLELTVINSQVFIEHSDIKKDGDLVNWIQQCAKN
jgi:alanine dehydrogenase